MVLDSRIGALDRTLGFLFGLGRGLLIVVVAFLFFAWLVPPRTQPTWVANAKSRVVLQSTGDWLMSMLPEDPENTILKRLKRPKPEEEPPDAQPEQRGSLGGSPREASYGQSDRSQMQRLIQGNTGHGAIAAR
jgi:membrane protein required for colicin V production